MPVSYEIHDDVIVVEGTGKATSEDFRRILRRLFNDASFQARMPVLVLDKGVRYYPPLEDADEAAMILRSYQDVSLGPVALVTTNPVQEGLGRVIEAFGNGLGTKFRVFRDGVEAREWLFQEPSDE